MQEAAEDATAVLVANRSGGVLGPHTILKEDHFPGCQSPNLPPILPGVPNFRGVGVRPAGIQQSQQLYLLESSTMLSCGLPGLSCWASAALQDCCLLTVSHTFSQR